MKLLLLDCETAPLVVYAWGLWDQRISHNHIVEEGRTLCFAAKWYGTDDVIFAAEWDGGHERMIRKAHSLLNEADAVIHYNGTSFDIPTLNAEFLFHKLPPPAPYKQVDLYRVVKSTFRLPSKKLDYVSKRLGHAGKVEHRGMDMWRGCMNGDRECQAEMAEYNKGDIRELEAVYEDLRPWCKTHPNVGLYEGGRVCPKCGSSNVERRGYATLATGVYRKVLCKSCRGWSREAEQLMAKEDRQNLLRNIA